MVPSDDSASSRSESLSPGEPLIVGIGASAGGVQALQRFFRRLPDDRQPMSFVVVVHLDPSHDSSLAEVLQAHTQMPVRQVTGRSKVEPDHVYVIPPNRSLALTDGHLVLSDFEEPRGRRAPIDLFFRSLAKVHEGGAVLVLSGSGSDGSVGLKAVKEEGGVVMAQDPGDAEHDGMPRSAIATGLVDVVGTVEDLAAKVVEFCDGRGRIRLPPDGDDLDEEDADALQRILAQLRGRTGHDFSSYKRSTILRRITRRMQVNHVDSLPAYLDHLRSDASEAEALLKNLLISVTQFFRDRESWDALADDVIPQIFADRGADEPVRAWVPGCATGEEAYTLAMLLLEHADELDTPPPVQVFATDIDEQALAHGREGRYPKAIIADVSEERLKRHFDEERAHYRIKKEVRERILFAVHGLLRDPPFSKLDLISCRNLLIYLHRDRQNVVFRLFHYALRQGGHVFLGNAESADEYDGLFRAVDRKRRIYRREDTAHPPELPTLEVTARRATEASVPRHPGLDAAEKDRHQALLEHQAPPSLVVNRSLEILHLSNNVGRYLQRSGGRPSHQLVKEVRPELRLELHAALHRAFETGARVGTRPIPVAFNGESGRVHLIVQPGSEEKGTRDQALVVFAEVDDTPARTDDDDQGPPAHDDELQLLRDRLRASLEEYETSREEMRAANEELQSVNEEYKSTTEELETSKEELQSVNEELETVNQELKNSVEELRQANSDLRNLMAATDVGTIFVGKHLTVQRYTPRVEEVFNIVPTDVGRPLAHLTHDLEYDDLREDAEAVLRDLTALEKEVRAADGAWFLVRMRPYRSDDDRIDGVVITLVDITRLKETEEALRVSEEELGREAAAMKDLYELVSRLLQCPDLSTALDEVVGALVEITNAQMGNIQLWDPADSTLRIVAQRGFDDDFLEYFREVRVEEGSACAAAVQNMARMVVTDVNEEPEYAPHREVAAAAGYRAVQSTPLISRQGELLGMLSTHYPEPHHPSEEDLRTLDLYARQAADFIARVRAEQDLHDVHESHESLEQRVEERTRQVRELSGKLTLAEQSERRRIAEILHDDLQQHLHGIRMKATLAERAFEAGNEDQLRECLGRIKEWLDTATGITRRLTVALNPPVLKSEGLASALAWLRTEMSDLHGLEVDIRSSDDFEIADEDRRVLLFQVVLELLFNVAKHAGTDHAVIDVEVVGDELVLRVSDDGRGMDVDTIHEKDDDAAGFGLVSVRERLNFLGGRMEIDSTPGEGTRVSVYAPLHARRTKTGDDVE